MRSAKLSFLRMPDIWERGKDRQKGYFGNKGGIVEERQSEKLKGCEQIKCTSDGYCAT